MGYPSAATAVVLSAVTPCKHFRAGAVYGDVQQPVVEVFTVGTGKAVTVDDRPDLAGTSRRIRQFVQLGDVVV
ncbi:MAG TPA: hypothetical protein VGQ26_02990, partial [Streptosporangiaceae bacterium]|nr:hypothetical protein [Streptosporangiaceae bacterium]